MDTDARIEALLTLSDRAFQERAQTGLDPVLPPLLEAYGLSVHHAGVQWRLARLQLTQGLATADPTVARGLFAEARASADRCLRDDPQIAARRTSQGFEAALAVVPPDRQPCVVWLSLAWVRWTIEIGPVAAALDLEAIDQLLAASVSYEERSLREIVDWARGLSLAIRPEWAGQDLSQARRLLDDAIDADKDALIRQVDRNRFVIAPQSSEDAAIDRLRILALQARNPEDVQAIAVLSTVE